MNVKTDHHKLLIDVEYQYFNADGTVTAVTKSGESYVLPMSLNTVPFKTKPTEV